MKDIHPIHFDIASLEGILQLFQLHGHTYTSVFALVDDGIALDIRQQFLGKFPQENVLVVKGGEDIKNIHSIEMIWDFLLRVKADRNALLVNLGGGALCDAGGFAASTFKRGIDFAHVPSTLLSMVDASVGGKTGINVGSVKNAVGTFSMPLAVFIHPPLLQSLPQREMLSGYAEMIKHGLIGNVQHLDNVLAEFAALKVPSISTIRESINIKAAIVGRDPYEKGERKLLNFGHTIGHGLESYLVGEFGTEAILHGEAVAAGILAEMFISNRLLGFPDMHIQRFKEIFHPLISHIKLSEHMLPQIMDKMRNDKKNIGVEIGITLLNDHGHGECNKTVSEELLNESLKFLVNINKN